MRFQCQPGCTACCEQHGFVYLTEEDILHIAPAVGLTPPDFEARYVYRTRRLRRLRVPGRKRCPFLVEGGCGIHKVKPLQCRAFPYWPGLIDDKRRWQLTAKFCPGIERGELINITLAREVADEMRAAHPYLCED